MLLLLYCYFLNGLLRAHCSRELSRGVGHQAENGGAPSPMCLVLLTFLLCLLTLLLLLHRRERTTLWGVYGGVDDVTVIAHMGL